MADPLTARLKLLIVETLRLEDVAPADIPDSEPLIGGGLSLDSIDALELVVRLEKEFGIKIASSEEARAAMASDKPSRIKSCAGLPITAPVLSGRASPAWPNPPHP